MSDVEGVGTCRNAVSIIWSVSLLPISIFFFFFASKIISGLHVELSGTATRLISSTPCDEL